MTKVNEFEAMAAEQQQNFEFQQIVDLDEEEKSFQKSNSSGSYIDFGQGIYYIHFP